jgi:hypothetical protein
VSTTIRAATLDDVDQLARLRWEFRVELGTTPSGAYAGFLESFRYQGDLDRVRPVGERQFDQLIDVVASGGA